MADSTAGRAADAARETMSEAANTAKDAAREQYESTREMLKHGGQEAVEQARSSIYSAAEEQKHRAADAIKGVARSLHEMARNLASEEQELPARYTDMAAEQIERLAGSLDQRSVGELMGDVETFARRQPMVFIGGAFAAGFLMSRFLKSRDETARRSYAGQRAYGGADTTLSSPGAAPGGAEYGSGPVGGFGGTHIERGER